jgi:PAS domain S-box-containing protein
MDLESLGAALTVVGVPAGGACAWIWYRYAEKHRSTVDELHSYIDRLNKDMADLKADYARSRADYQDSEIRCDSLAAQLRAEREADRQRYDADIRRMANRISKLQVDNQALRSELSLTRVAEAATRTGLNPFFAHPGLFASTVIIANARGRILDATAGAAILFHWSPEELIGRNIEVLIPERYRPAHQAGMAGLVHTGELTQQGHTLALAGLTRDGDEVPVDIYLESWTAQGEKRCGAVIRRRWLAHEPTPGILSSDDIPVVGETGLPVATVPVPVPVQVVNPPERPVPVQRTDAPAFPAGEARP